MRVAVLAHPIAAHAQPVAIESAEMTKIAHRVPSTVAYVMDVVMVRVHRTNPAVAVWKIAVSARPAATECATPPSWRTAVTAFKTVVNALHAEMVCATRQSLVRAAREIVVVVNLAEMARAPARNRAATAPAIVVSARPAAT